MGEENDGISQKKEGYKVSLKVIEKVQIRVYEKDRDKQKA